MVDSDKKEDESSKGAYGYLKMSGEPSHYTKMEQAQSHPTDQNKFNEDIDRDKSPYINKKQWCKEKSSDNVISSHYTKMKQAPSHPIDQNKLNEDIDRAKSPYINKKQWWKENSSAVELQPLRANEDSDNVIARQSNTREQYINTSSYCQRNDDTVTEDLNVSVSIPISDHKAGPEDEM